MNCAEFQARFSTGCLKRGHVLHGKYNLNFRSALLCHAGLVERDVVAAIRASEYKPTFLFNSRQGLKAKMTMQPGLRLLRISPPTASTISPSPTSAMRAAAKC